MIADNRLFFRDLLVADLALVMSGARAKKVAQALEDFWADRERAEEGFAGDLARIAGISIDALDRIDATVRRCVADAGGDFRLAVLGRGGIDSSIHASLTESGSALAREFAEIGVAARHPLRPPSDGRYEGFTPIGAGGMGLVYLARDTELDREVAFKVVMPRPGARAHHPFDLEPPADQDPDAGPYEERSARFLWEARVTSALDHPGMLPVYELGVTPAGLAYYTMRYVRTERTLAAALEDAPTLEARLALLPSFLRVCDAVRYAHSRGVLHRDLKPVNIALGEFGEVIVLDWGLARAPSVPEDATDDDAIGDGLTAGRALGTPGYMSPEAARGEADLVDVRTDVYSLGATLYEILTGSPPFLCGSLRELRELLDRSEPRAATAVRPLVPRPLSDVCARALRREPRDRFPDVGSFSAAIRDWQAASEVDREVESLLGRAKEDLADVERLEGDALLARLDRVTAAALRVAELRPGEPTSSGLISSCESIREEAIARRERRGRARLLRRVGGVAAIALLVGSGFAFRAIERGREDAEMSRSRSETLATYVAIDLERTWETVGRLDLLAPMVRTARGHYEALRPEEMSEREYREWSLVLANAGRILRAEADFDGAMAAFEKSLEIRRSLVEKAPGAVGPRGEILAVLMRIGNLEDDLGRIDGAARTYHRCLEIGEPLVREAPRLRSARGDLAVVRARLGNLRFLRGEVEAGRALLYSAVSALEGLVAEDPKRATWGRTLVQVRLVLGNALRIREELGPALDQMERARREARALLAEEPHHAALKDEFAESTLGVTSVLLLEGRLEEALAHSEEAVALRESLHRLDGTNMEWRFDLALAWQLKADVLWLNGNLDEALALYEQCRELVRGAGTGRAVLTVWQSSLWTVLERLGQLHGEIGSSDDVLRLRRESVEFGRKFLERAPRNRTWRLAHANGLCLLGQEHRRRNEYSEALECLGKSLGILQDLSREDSGWLGLRRDLSRVHRALGDLEVLCEEYSGAERYYRAALADLVIEEEQDSAVWQAAVALTRETLGGMLSRRRRGPPREAEEQLRAAVALRRRLARLGPSSPLRHRRLAHSLILLANHHEREEERWVAEDVHLEALEAIRRAVELDPALAHLEEEQRARYMDLMLERWE